MKYFKYLFFVLNLVCLTIKGEHVYMVYNSNSDTTNEQYRFPTFSINSIKGTNSIILTLNNNNYEFYLNETGVLNNLINTNKNFLVRLMYGVKEMEEIVNQNYKYVDPRLYTQVFPNYKTQINLPNNPLLNLQPKLENYPPNTNRQNGPNADHPLSRVLNTTVLI